jgi:hypothetical protein
MDIIEAINAATDSIVSQQRADNAAIRETAERARYAVYSEHIDDGGNLLARERLAARVKAIDDKRYAEHAKIRRQYADRYHRAIRQVINERRA